MIASWPASKRSAWLAARSDEELLELKYRWRFWARPKQLAPSGNWRLWLLQTGRGFGKTRSAAEWVRDEVKSGRRGAWHFIGKDDEAARVTMIEGISGILRITPPQDRPRFVSSKGELHWPNGAKAIIFSSHEPDKLRGPECDGLWLEEMSTWEYLTDTYDNAMLGFRLGQDPRGVATTTPKPLRLLRELRKDPTVVITHGSTYENRANLAPAFLSEIVKRYEGTAKGRQELFGELLDQAEGALWQRAWIEGGRVAKAPALVRIVVAIDPAVSSTSDSAETGMVVEGWDAREHLYVLADLSGRMSPGQWGTRAIDAFMHWRADRIVAEVNQGGDLVESNIRQAKGSKGENGANMPYRGVHASRGKYTRAEPVSALYEQGRAHHVGVFPDLEDQFCTWEPGQDSPDRLDASVWGGTDLMENTTQTAAMSGVDRGRGYDV